MGTKGKVNHQLLLAILIGQRDHIALSVQMRMASMNLEYSLTKRPDLCLSERQSEPPAAIRENGHLLWSKRPRRVVCANENGQHEPGMSTNKETRFRFE